MRDIIYTREANRALQRMPTNTAAKIRSKIEQYAIDPTGLANNVKALKGKQAGTFRLRVGDYRVIFSENGTVLSVLKAGHRSDIYV